MVTNNIPATHIEGDKIRDILCTVPFLFDMALHEAVKNDCHLNSCTQIY